MPARMSFQLANNAVPIAGSCGIPVILDFTLGNTAQGDFALEQTSGTIDFVQSMFIDNSLNTKALTIQFSGTKQIITLKAGMVGEFPIHPANGTFQWFATSVGANVQVPVIFMNQPANPYVYQAV